MTDTTNEESVAYWTTLFANALRTLATLRKELVIYGEERTLFIGVLDEVQGVVTGPQLRLDPVTGELVLCAVAEVIAAEIKKQLPYSAGELIEEAT
jgi:hypothetical protein